MIKSSQRKNNKKFYHKRAKQAKSQKNKQNHKKTRKNKEIQKRATD